MGWKYFQPEKNRYDWSLVDDVIEQWVSKGKRVAFCWEVCCPNTMDGQSCPLWLRDECGAEGVEYNLYYESKKYGFNVSEEFDRPTWVPYYNDPIFLEYFSKFLKEAGRRFNGKDWVEFIEIGSIGTWGEGHVHMSWPNPITPDMIPLHLNMWRDAFPDTRLLVVDELINNRPSAMALSKELGLGVIDDSVQVPSDSTPAGCYANEEVFDEFWQNAVCGIEHHPGTVATSVYYESLWMSHASYCRLHMNPYHMQTGSGEWVDKMTKRMGYRLTVEEIDTSKIEANKNARIKIKIKNTGVAPCYDGGYPAVFIKNSEGEVVFSKVSDFNVNTLKVYENTDKANCDEVEIKFVVPDLPNGNYSLHIAVCDKNGKPLYNLPLNKGENKIYRICGIKL